MHRPKKTPPPDVTISPPYFFAATFRGGTMSAVINYRRCAEFFAAAIAAATKVSNARQIHLVRIGVNARVV
jgi:hypothetical protein